MPTLNIIVLPDCHHEDTPVWWKPGVPIDPRNSCRGAVDASCPNILNVGVISCRNSSGIIFLRCVFVPLFLIYCCCNPVLMTRYSRIMVKGSHNFYGSLESNSIHLPHWQWQVLVWTDLRLLSPWQRPSFCCCFCPNCLLVVVALGSLLKVITLLDYYGFAWISFEAYSTLSIYCVCPSQPLIVAIAITV